MRHLLDLKNLTLEEVEAIFARASKRSSKTAAPKETLKGRIVLTSFFENSTRTRVSFALAGEKLGAKVIDTRPDQSSIRKGETLLDTVRTLLAMKPDAMVLRHSAAGAPHFLCRELDPTDCAIINAGDGAHSHPTQALIDAFTIRQERGGPAGLRVVICGDIRHSRVARANLDLLGRMGAQLRILAPRSLLPEDRSAWGVTCYSRVEEAFEGADIIMLLRLQLERMGGVNFTSLKEYFHFWGITHQKLSYAKPDALVFHPGPQNRGVEIASELADDLEKVRIDAQVANGVAIRMAVLEHCIL